MTETEMHGDELFDYAIHNLQNLYDSYKDDDTIDKPVTGALRDVIYAVANLEEPRQPPVMIKASDAKELDIAKEPKNCVYNSVDFETVGKCPTCGTTVYDSIGGRQERCKVCNQKLLWR